MTEVAVPAVRSKLAPILSAVVLTVLLLWMFGVTAHVFILLFIGIILSLYLGAVRDFFEERAGLPHRAAFLLAVFGSVAMLVGLFWLLIPPVYEQTRQLIQVLPQYIENWEQGIDRFMLRFPALRDVWNPGEHRVLRAVYDQISSWGDNAVPKVFSLVQALIDIFAVIVMSLYLTLQPAVYREWLIALFPPVHRDLVRDLLTDLANTLRAYIVGQLFTMAVLAALTAIGLWVLGVPYWLTFGVFTGLVAIVPFFGTLLSTTLPALFVVAGPNGGVRAMLVLGLGVVVHLIEGNVVAPLVMSEKLELPPILTIMAVLVLGKILGPLGLVVAVPTLAVVMVLVRRILINRIYEGHGFRKSMRDRSLLLRVPAPDGGVITPNPPVTDVIGLKEKLDKEGAA